MFKVKKSCHQNLFLSFMLPLLILFFLSSLSSCKPSTDLKKATFSRLTKIRTEKKQKVINYFGTVRKLAFEMQTDKKMSRFFLEMKKNNGNLNLEYALDEYSVSRYGQFYDILFIDNSGYIFHSLRKESDYRTNIFNGRMAKTKLATGLKQRKNFVEYDFYSPSGEPAAFFAMPLKQAEKQLGWIVLQCAINQVNTILTERKSLGRTGEVYLVNKNRLMLSDSRFLEDSTILKLKVDTEAVKNSFKHHTGESIINDYRGIRVFSSFEKFDLFGTSWIIITEIDEDEVLTDYYRKNRKYYNSEISDYLAERVIKNKKSDDKPKIVKRIDINEFAKAEPGELIKTYGVATCTAVTILFKNKFCYLSHISPMDKIYRRPRFINMLQERKSGDFLGELINKVKYFDLYPYELRELEFVVIAPHFKSFSGAVDEILNNGMELSNIKFMYNPTAICANVIADASQNTAIVNWVSDKAEIMEYSSGVEDLSSIFKKIIQYDI